MKMQLMNETLRYDVLNNETIHIKKKNLLRQNYLFHRNLQFQKFIETSPSVLPMTRMRDEDQTHTHPSQPLSPTTTQWLGEHHVYTLAYFNLY